MSPMVGVATVNACLFGVYGHLMDLQKKLYGEQHYLCNVFVAGCCSGLANSVISCPSELAKIQLQNQIDVKHFSGPWQCLQAVYRGSGVSGCFRGWWATVYREVPSYGVYFGCFEAMRGWCEGEDGGVDGSRLMLVGGLSGVLGWLSTYPFDVAKTRIQALPVSCRSVPSCTAVILGIYKVEGFRSLFKGLNATILRAFPTNAVIFYTYTLAMDFLSVKSF